MLLMKRGGQVIYMGPLGRNSETLIKYFDVSKPVLINGRPCEKKLMVVISLLFFVDLVLQCRQKKTVSI